MCPFACLVAIIKVTQSCHKQLDEKNHKNNCPVAKMWILHNNRVGSQQGMLKQVALVFLITTT